MESEITGKFTYDTWSLWIWASVLIPQSNGSILLPPSLYRYTSIALMVLVWWTQPLKTPEVNFENHEVN